MKIGQQMLKFQKRVQILIFYSTNFIFSEKSIEITLFMPTDTCTNEI